MDTMLAGDAFRKNFSGVHFFVVPQKVHRFLAEFNLTPNIIMINSFVFPQVLYALGLVLVTALFFGQDLSYLDFRCKILATLLLKTIEC